MDGLDEDLLGDATAHRDGRVAPAVVDEQRAPEEGLAVQDHDIILVESQGHQASPDVFSAGELDDPEGRVAGSL